MEDMEAWRDHPNVDIIDNSSKISRLNDLVVKRIGIDVGNRWTQEIFLNQTIDKFQVCVFFRFQLNSQKVKFVVSGMYPGSAFTVKFTDFQVCHDNTY